jgi:CheY-like chemotaxis protein
VGGAGVKVAVGGAGVKVAVGGAGVKVAVGGGTVGVSVAGGVGVSVGINVFVGVGVMLGVGVKLGVGVNVGRGVLVGARVAVGSAARRCAILWGMREHPNPLTSKTAPANRVINNLFLMASQCPSFVRAESNEGYYTTAVCDHQKFNLSVKASQCSGNHPQNIREIICDSNPNHTLLCYPILRTELTMEKPLRLLILDDDPEVIKHLTASLTLPGVVVYSATDATEAGQLMALLHHDILLIGVEKLVCTPIYPLQEFRQTQPDLKIVGVSQRRAEDSGLLLDLLGLDAYLNEPVTPESLSMFLPSIAERCQMA